ncbi:hypothetical protein [Streptomyces sp. NPDC127072]|uniref:hypothetical protein n=1 Tax=Streptomyces sp. NPDC127072 TaxID=3347129 RepID=UPI00364B5562
MSDPARTPRASHAARTRSAAFRAAAICHHVQRPDSGADSGAGSDAQAGGKAAEAREPGAADQEIVWKSAHAARVAAQALAVLTESAPAPAADSRCARNAAASAAQAARMAALHDGAEELAAAACDAALLASRAAADAAGAEARGADETLNARADAAEADAVAAAVRAGWIRPGEDLPQVSTGVRSPEVMSMLHL